METVAKFIYGFVDILGQRVKRFINCVVDIEDESTLDFYVLNNNQYIKENLDNVESIQVSPINGRLLIGDKVLSNATLSIYKEKTLIDVVKTSEDGYYNLYITPGNYSLDINHGIHSQKISNYKFPKGLSPHSFIMYGAIKQKNKDIITFYDTEYILVTGKINHNDGFKKGTEIVISDNDDKVHVFYIMDEDGTYKFALKPGTYNVRFRFENQNVVIVNDVDINTEIGFLEAINEKSNIFRGDKISWIYN